MRPEKTETFKFATDPELAAKVTDVVGLYLALQNAINRALYRSKEPDPGAEPRRSCRCRPVATRSAPSYFGMKPHPGVDAGRLPHSVTATAANIHDLAEIAQLIRADEEIVLADAGY